MRDQGKLQQDRRNNEHDRTYVLLRAVLADYFFTAQLPLLPFHSPPFFFLLVVVILLHHLLSRKSLQIRPLLDTSIPREFSYPNEKRELEKETTKRSHSTWLGKLRSTTTNSWQASFAKQFPATRVDISSSRNLLYVLHFLLLLQRKNLSDFFEFCF